MLDFLFITSPTNARNPHPPYYFMYLASYLRNKGLDVKIIDPKGGDRPDDMKLHMLDIVSKVAENTSRFVGLAAFHSDYDMILELGEMIKFVQPHTTLLVGNAHATLNPEDFIYSISPFDIAVLGEGEVTCLEIWKWYEEWSINNLDALSKVKGIAYYDPDQVEPFVRTGKRHVLNMADLSYPDYHLIDMQYYLRPQKLIIRRIYTSMVCVFAGRGCPFDCSFCAANNVWQANKGKACRLRPVNNVIQELCHLKNYYNPDFFYLFDDMFGMSKKWMREWFDEKAVFDYALTTNEKFGVPFPYATQTRADIASEEMIKGLKETGCIQLDIGVESGSQTLLDGVNKKITLDQIRQVFSWCKKYKLRSFATMLLNLPGETEQDLKLTYNFLKEIKPSAGVIFGVTTPYPGTKIYQRHCEPLRRDEYRLLINNRLNPSQDRFKMSSHNLDLWKLLEKWNRRFKATPAFERMWALRPFQKLYWKAIFNSTRKKEYMGCWIKDLFKTLILYGFHITRLYKLVKKMQYKDKY